MSYRNSDFGLPVWKRFYLFKTRTFIARRLISLGHRCGDLASAIAPWLRAPL